MTKIDIVSGFLGAGKTTLIKKLLKEAFTGEQVVLIENEFGEIGIDGGFLKESGIEIREMNSGCICCSLVGDFGTSLKEVLDKYTPDRILIEPSGVGKLSDVMRAVEGATAQEGVHLNSAVAVVDAKKCKTYLKNFGEFFENQILAIFTPIRSDDNEDVVMILSSLEALSESYSTGSANLSFLVNDDGTLIIHPDLELMNSGVEIKDHYLVKNLPFSKSKAEQVTYKNEDGIEYIGAYTKLDIGSCAVITEIQTKVVLEAVYATTRRNIYLTIAILSIAIMIV